ELDAPAALLSARPAPRKTLAAGKNVVDLVRRGGHERDVEQRSDLYALHAARVRHADDRPDHDPERRGRRGFLMRRSLSVGFCVIAVAACSGPKPAPAPPCDQACQDGAALRGMRETVKLVYNLKLQGKPVGMHDETTPCPGGGTAHVTGTAMSNAT